MSRGRGPAGVRSSAGDLGPGCRWGLRGHRSLVKTAVFQGSGPRAGLVRRPQEGPLPTGFLSQGPSWGQGPGRMPFRPSGGCPGQEQGGFQRGFHGPCVHPSGEVESRAVPQWTLLSPESPTRAGGCLGPTSGSFCILKRCPEPSTQGLGRRTAVFLQVRRALGTTPTTPALLHRASTGSTGSVSVVPLLRPVSPLRETPTCPLPPPALGARPASGRC